ncbi:FAD-dependent oxidoreductase [Nocardia goodfellowii]|uniref:Glycine/D-amino acid oxidase-like deaminating enzyme/nitrite reductase/ring-hydroxylating ferredoxin subunit n=1 Tax=Nocardia goodfellowii TaxID=882446 RepID=A0ABS4QIY6_9NOCA|nr:FAD-dependent oxidoreductase [Nocardia goodfellowii]MBP2191673.1 glycine/D-amino acid oxidase-like deaminating enzyme/nitrite reductase/ring-hydroxylating ferredoxin subunit [Nocardia goodfellowii]
MTSLWTNDAEVPARLRLTPGLRFDTVVIGGGITGLVTALLLAENGIEVAVVEARRVGAAASGLNTGKISLLQGTRAQKIAGRHSIATLRDYLAANRAGQDWLVRFCAEHNVTLQRESALTYAQTAGEMKQVRAEYEATQQAGLPTELVGKLEVPFPAHGAVRLADQVQVDPMALVAALAAQVEAYGAPIYESSRAHGVRSGPDGDLLIDTEHGELAAHSVVLATAMPILDRGGFFARLEPQRSYLTAYRVPQPIPREMMISAGQPTKSLRYAPSPEGELLIVGGNAHGVGRTDSASAHVEALVDWTGRWFPGAEPLYRWSAQDHHPIAELPYAGPLLPGQDRILVATGFAKWGLTNGTAAALALAGRRTGKPPAWAEVFGPWQTSELKGWFSAVKANAEVAQQMSSGWLLRLAGGPGTAPAEGCGTVERHGVHPVAVCTVDGATTEVSAVCPHLGGIVRWNDAEKSWDCPLHGSRFAPDGTVLEGPATKGLTPRLVPPPAH